MGILDVVRGLLGDAHHETAQPSVAEITIISTDAVSQSSESQPPQASG